MDIRQIIRDEMDRRGMTQTRLAELADMTQARISDYLNGVRDVRAETLARMLKALKLEIKPRKGK